MRGKEVPIVLERFYLLVCAVFKGTPEDSGAGGLSGLLAAVEGDGGAIPSILGDSQPSTSGLYAPLARSLRSSPATVGMGAR